MRASVVQRQFRCGTPGCRCTKGERHQDVIATRSLNGKTQTVRIRNGRETMAREWAENWRTLQSIVAELTAIELEILRLPKVTSQSLPQKKDNEKADLFVYITNSICLCLVII